MPCVIVLKAESLEQALAAAFDPESGDYMLNPSLENAIAEANEHLPAGEVVTIVDLSGRSYSHEVPGDGGLLVA